MCNRIFDLGGERDIILTGTVCDGQSYLLVHRPGDSVGALLAVDKFREYGLSEKAANDLLTHVCMTAPPPNC